VAIDAEGRVSLLVWNTRVAWHRYVISCLSGLPYINTTILVRTIPTPHKLKINNDDNNCNTDNGCQFFFLPIPPSPLGGCKIISE